MHYEDGVYNPCPAGDEERLRTLWCGPDQVVGCVAEVERHGREKSERFVDRRTEVFEVPEVFVGGASGGADTSRISRRNLLKT